MAEATGPKIYIGPTIPGSFLRPGQIWAALPRPIEDLMSRFPEMHRLFVTSGNYQKALGEIGNPASRIGIAYQTFKAKIQTGDVHHG